MSFRTRLTSFFVLIVVVPMIAIGALVFRLIGDSEQGKADARASGLAAAAASLYASQAAAARTDAQSLARHVAALPSARLAAQLQQLAAQAGVARVRVTAGSRVLADVGSPHAIAPGTARLGTASGALSVTASTITASDYARQLSSVPGVGVVVRSGARTLGFSVRVPRGLRLPRQGTVTQGGVTYRVVTQTATGFGGAAVRITVLSDLTSTRTSVASSRLIAAVIIAAFLLLAFGFSILASRALQGQLRRFLEAAQRLGGGDFSSAVPVEGQDEFAALGAEFNNMSTQLAQRLEELSQERARLRESIARIGQTFASNLNREALLRLALRTALDAVQGDCGRISLRAGPDQPLEEIVREGDVGGLESELLHAEREALRSKQSGEAEGHAGALSVALGLMDEEGRVRGLITVARREARFGDEDRDLLRSLAAQATLALENVELHHQVSRQAVTDELTGLANRGRFQDLLNAEVEQVRRYHHPLGLIMVDVDNFKSVNDTYGHPQGDLVLKHVARVLHDNSREADTPARYGGEEMALILPHTDLEGSYAIAERVRTAIEHLTIERLDGQGRLQITASLGVTATTDGETEKLIADADAALYEAKRAGKNRTVRASGRGANVKV